MYVRFEHGGDFELVPVFESTGGRAKSSVQSTARERREMRIRRSAVGCIVWLGVSSFRTSISDNHERNVWDKVKHNHDDFEEA